MVANKNIKVSRDTKKRLDNLKLHSRETYDDILNRMLEHLNGDGKLKGIKKNE